VVRAEDSQPRESGFKSQHRCIDHQHVPLNWINNVIIILCENEPGTIAYAVILKMGGWTL
jgi:hypothetical protein